MDSLPAQREKKQKKTERKPVVPPREALLQYLAEQARWSPAELALLRPLKWRLLGKVLLLSPLLVPSPSPSQDKVEAWQVAPLQDPLKRTQLVEALRHAVPHTDAVVAQLGKIQGELRTPHVLVLTDPVLSPTETIHIENGIQFKMDVTKVMFAAGNGTERMRFAQFKVEGETIVDMFAGIGYFTVPVAKRGRPARLIAIEKNPDSAHFLRENVRLNGVGGIVTVLEGDNRLEGEPYCGHCDRVFLGYLPSAEPFVPRALQFAKRERAMLHYHYVASQEEAPLIPLAHLQAPLAALGRLESTKLTVLHIENVKNYAPHLWHYVADVLLEDTPLH